MPQIKFSVSKELCAYLRWFAEDILSEASEHPAAKHLMMQGLEHSRRKHRENEPKLAELDLTQFAEEQFAEEKPDADGGHN